MTAMNWTRVREQTILERSRNGLPSHSADPYAPMTPRKAIADRKAIEDEARSRAFLAVGRYTAAVLNSSRLTPFSRRLELARGLRLALSNCQHWGPRFTQAEAFVMDQAKRTLERSGSQAWH